MPATSSPTGCAPMRERQVAMMQESMSHLWSVVQSLAPPSPRPGRRRPSRWTGCARRSRRCWRRSTTSATTCSRCRARPWRCSTSAPPEPRSAGGGGTRARGPAAEGEGAFASASTQTSAVIDEMKKRMASLEQDTRKAVAPAEAAKTCRTGAHTQARRAAAKATPAARSRPRRRRRQLRPRPPHRTKPNRGADPAAQGPTDRQGRPEGLSTLRRYRPRAAPASRGPRRSGTSRTA